ncbi:MAG: hypothetical protein QQN63_03160, partial [Nitrosopumilus sp.]
MSDFDYYTPPSDKIFNEVKSAAIRLWRGYDDTHGYASEKVNHIKDIQNISDNCCFMVAMFDHQNQKKLISMVEGETKEWLESALEE